MQKLIQEQAGKNIYKTNGRCPALVPVAREGELLPSYAQQRLWMLDQIDGGSAHYNMPGALTLSGLLDHHAINRAFSTILERHESLRTCFVAGEDGQPYQVIQPARAYEVPVHDVSMVEEILRRQRINELAEEETARPFDLGADLMLRAQLLKVAENEHVLLVTLHHIASDGWSLAIFFNEFSTLYSAYLQGQGNPLAPLAIQYADYAHWQRHWLQGEVLEVQLGYWEKQLAGLPAVRSLPLDRPRPSRQSFAGSYHHSLIDAKTSRTLQALCRAQGATLFMGLQAAFATLLSRYSNETDIVMGIPIANREQLEIAGLIGFFANTLVLRSDLSGGPSFTALLNQSKAMLLEAYAHQQVPFEQVVERLRPQRSLSYSALFQVMLILQNNKRGSLELRDLTLGALVQTSVIAKYDLTLSVVEGKDGLHLNWEYSTALFDRETIERIAGHFGRLLAALVEMPNESVFQVEMLSQAERHQMLVAWNGTQHGYPKDRTIHELFEVQAARTPDHVAVVFEGEELTYRYLNEKANRLAHWLRASGVGPDELVGICVERGLEMVVGLLGILKAGGAYVPLDPSYPAERLSYMVEDASPRVVLTQERLKGEFPLNQAQVLCLDSQWEEISGYSGENPDNKTLAQQLAYVIYTSGSTGKPKGVGGCIGALVNRLAWMQGAYPIRPGERHIQKTSINFIDSITETLLPLLFGGQLCIAPAAIGADPERLWAFMQEHGITRLVLVPSLLAALLDSDPALHTQIGVVISSGEPLPAGLAERAAWMLPSTVLLNLYGSSEVAGDVSFHPCISAEEPIISVPLGRPIWNTQIYLLDEAMSPVPVGVAGELYIGGDGLARGYLKRPELTAEKFVPNPYGEAGSRLYRMGDLGRYLADGNIEYLGRIDHQVKIRGFRIELGEIEAALCGLEGVREAVVVAQEEAPGNKRLAAYVVIEEWAEQDLQALRQGLNRSLPEYMVPTAWKVLERLPLMPNGKVDRNALPTLDMNRVQREHVAPRNETEQAVCEIWQNVLGVPRVGIHDNFFELGGHSILVMLLVRNLKKIGIYLTVREIYEAQTISAMSESLSLKREDAPLICQDQVHGTAPLMANQHWFLKRLNLDHWNGPSRLWELSPKVDPNILRTALGDVLQHHDGLRRIFVKEGGHYAQYFLSLEEMGPWWKTIDLDHVESDALAATLEAHCTAQHESIDISASLFKAVYFNMGEGRNARLLLVIHQTLFDPFSVTIFYEDLINRYIALAGGREHVFPSKTTSIKEWAEWQYHYAQEGAVEHLQYWRSRSWKKYRQLPIEKNEVGLIEDAGSVIMNIVEARLTEEETFLLEKRSIDAGFSLEHVLMTALILAWEKRTGSAALFLLFMNNGRANKLAEGIDLSRTVGWLPNYVNIMFDLSEADAQTSLKHKIKIFQKQMTEVEDGGLSFTCLRNINEDASIREEMAALPSFQLEFTYLPTQRVERGDRANIFHVQDIIRPAMEPRGVVEGEMHSKFAPFAKAIHENGRLNIYWGFSPVEFTKKIMQDLADEQMEFVRKISKELA